MKIGIISDTHDRVPTFRRAVAMFERLGVVAVFHAGDFVAPFAAELISPGRLSVPVYCVYGNNDGERVGLKKVLPGVVDGPLRVEVGGRTVVMHHWIDWLKPADLVGADVVITGHTHEVVNEVRNGVLFLNPGECCGWVNDRCTVMLLDLETMKADVVDL
jgi:uncharacterized protein